VIAELFSACVAMLNGIVGLILGLLVVVVMVCVAVCVGICMLVSRGR